MDSEPSFEEALRQLERIVDDLEGGEPELSTALEKYEAGVRLLARCHRVLDRAERSVALLTGVKEDGSPVTTPFDEDAAPGPTDAPATPRRRKPPPGRSPDTDAANDRVIS